MAAWYRVLTRETRAYISVVGFESIVRLLSERSARAILVQNLVER